MCISDRIAGRLKLDIPTCIPVYDKYLPDSAYVIEPMEYIYVSIPNTIHRNVRAYVAHTNDFAPIVEEGSIIMVDSAQKIKDNDTAACLIDGLIHIGKIRKLGGKLWLENNSGKLLLQNSQLIGVVIGLEK